MVLMFLLTGKAKRGVFTTGRLMRRLSVVFAGDVLPYVAESPLQFYERVRNIPYREDPDGMELVQRPALTLASRGLGGDCDDKMICMGAYFYQLGIEYRFVAAKRNPNGPLHHTWIQAYIEEKWQDFDCTYAWNDATQRIGHWHHITVIG